MKKKQFMLIILSTCIFSFLGGGLSSQIFFGNLVFASGPYEEIVAYKFRLLDENEETRALLYASEDSKKTHFEIFDKTGKLHILLKVEESGIPSAHFWDKEAAGRTEVIANYPSINFWDNNNKLYAKVPIWRNHQEDEEIK